MVTIFETKKGLNEDRIGMVDVAGNENNIGFLYQVKTKQDF